MFLGLRSHIVAARDLDISRAWYARVLGFPPYFDEPFYVGFEVGGYELGLLPGRPDDYPAGGETYWGVADIDDARQQLLSMGAIASGEISDVGGGIRMAILLDPGGNRIGIIENPNFQAASAG